MLLWSTAVSAADLPRLIEPDPSSGSSAAVVVGDWPLVHTAQILPASLAANAPAPAAAQQVEQVLDQLDEVLSAADSSLAKAIKLNFYVAEPVLVSVVSQALARRFGGDHQPAVSFVTTRLTQPAALVAVDAVATTARNPGEAVQVLPAASVTPNGSRIYVSGQAESGGTLAEATRRTLESLRQTLRFLGRTDADVLQLKAFLMPMADAATVQREIAAFYGERTPPTVLVEWQSAANTPIEIELIAWGGQGPWGDAVEYLTPPGMTASPVFSRVARVNHARAIYVSGLYGAPTSTDAASDASPGEREVTSVFTTLDRILSAAGSDMRHLVKATYYVSTDDASRRLNELRPRYYDAQRPPSASKALVSNVGKEGRGLAMDMIAVPVSRAERPEDRPNK